MGAPATIVYKVCPAAHWQAAVNDGVFRGVAVDLRDGYIHFSTAAQLAETAAKHFAGQDDLILIALDVATLGDALRWEPSRGGDLFPHLYGEFRTGAVHWVAPLPRGADGKHVFPEAARIGR